jgi:hypothetical protein
MSIHPFEAFLDPNERIAFRPLFNLLFGPIRRGITLEVAAEAIGLGFDEGWAAAASGPVNGLDTAS